MTTKVLYTNGNSITVEGTSQSPLTVRVPGVIGEITDKGVDGANVMFKKTNEELPLKPSIALNDSKFSATGAEIDSSWITSVTWAPPERRA